MMDNEILPLFRFKDLGDSDYTHNHKALKADTARLKAIHDAIMMQPPKPPVYLKPNKQRQVLDMLIRDGSVTAYDIQRETNSTDARKIASRLRKEGYISRTEQIVGHSGIKHAVYYWSGKVS